MSLEFYDNFHENIATDSKTYWREQQQAVINKYFDNTTLKVTIQEENNEKDFTFHDVECWVGTVTDAIITTEKNVDDYRNLYFEDITHSTTRGCYYEFDNNYWLVYENTDALKTVSDAKVRRCNNWLKWIDNDGILREYPCVLDYNLMSPAPQVSKAITTANGHVTIIVQGNEQTLKIPKNTRFLFNGTPYKYVAINNYMQNDYVSQDTPLLFLEAYWDTIQPNDNLEENIADDVRYHYAININQEDIEQSTNTQGTLTAVVTKNEDIISAEIEWSSSDETVVTINANGEYTIVGEVGTNATITATMVGNTDCTDSITVTVVESEVQNKELIVSPIFSLVRLFQSQDFTANVYNNDEKLDDVVTCEIDGLNATYYTLTDNGNNSWTLTNNKQSTTPIIVRFTSGDLVKELSVKLGALY